MGPSAARAVTEEKPHHNDTERNTKKPRSHVSHRPSFRHRCKSTAIAGLSRTRRRVLRLTDSGVGWWSVRREHRPIRISVRPLESLSEKSRCRTNQCRVAPRQSRSPDRERSPWRPSRPNVRNLSTSSSSHCGNRRSHRSSSVEHKCDAETFALVRGVLWSQ